MGKDSFTSLQHIGAVLSNYKEKPSKGSSGGARAQFGILNNKPMQGLYDFFVSTVDTMSLGHTKVPPEETLAFLHPGGQVNFLEFQAEPAMSSHLRL